MKSNHLVYILWITSIVIFLVLYHLLLSSKGKLTVVSEGEEVAVFKFRYNGYSKNIKTEKRQFDEILIKCNVNTPWRDLNEVIEALLASRFRFNYILCDSGEHDIRMFFPENDQIPFMEFDRWNDKRIQVIEKIRKPVLPMYESESEFVVVARLSEEGSVCFGFSTQPLTLNENGKISSCVLYVPGNARFSSVEDAEQRIARLGFKHVVFVEGEVPGKWPPYYLPRTLKEIR